MNRLQWRPLSLADRDAIMEYIAQDNPSAAIGLDLDFEAKAENARRRPKLYKPGRMKGTREIVVRPNYVMVYRVTGELVEILRVLHAAQQWP
ncbi:MAG TPA: type II toxin-antitoxin system RelE/ParE family toxin [Rhizobacter sp.]|nr:type II toxin-antitoxin system RelE/ParE family toxin [Rhizobacter sp.]